MIVPSCDLASVRPMRCGASKPFSRITRRTRRGLARTPAKRNRAHNLVRFPGQVMQAASDITGGMIMHYSSAGRTDPVYNANPTPHAFYKDRSGQIDEFPSVVDAQKAAKAARAHKSPDAPAGRITQLNARSPDQWSDVSSQGAPRAGRYVGDCESKVYMQTRLHRGRLHVARQRRHAARGRHRPHVRRVQGARRHDLGHVERGVPSGEPEQCQGGRDAGRPRRDVAHDDRPAVPHPKSERIKFSAAATANLPTTGNPPVNSIRHSTELGMMGRSEVLIVPPAGAQAGRWQQRAAALVTIG